MREVVVKWTCNSIKPQRTLIRLLGGNFGSVHAGMFIIQSCAYMEQAVLWDSEHLVNKNGQAMAEGWADRETVEEIPEQDRTLRTHGIPWVYDSVEWNPSRLKIYLAPLLSFLWSWSGLDGLADIQEVWALGQARQCLAEWVNLLGLPLRSSSTAAWINLQGCEHSHVLLNWMHCATSQLPTPPNPQSYWFYFHLQRRHIWGERGLDILKALRKHAWEW